MVKSKPSFPLEDNESKIQTDRNKGRASKPNHYRGKKPQNKLSPYPKSDTNFQGQCTYLEGYIFDLGPRSFYKYSQTMK